jgi:hypothetical protein
MLTNRRCTAWLVGVVTILAVLAGTARAQTASGEGDYPALLNAAATSEWRPALAYRPVVTYEPVTAYRTVTRYTPVTEYEPYTAYRPVTTYKPVATCCRTACEPMVGRLPFTCCNRVAAPNYVCRPVFVPGEPIRNFFRALFY